MSEKEIMSLQEGTKIKVKDGVECHESLKKVGNLIFQSRKDQDHDEFRYGIHLEDCVCYMFCARQYELVK